MRGIPAAVQAEVRGHLQSLGLDATRWSVRPVGGGCISPSVRLDVGGEPFFLKWARDEGTQPDFFASEARSLEALRAAGAIRVPAVRGVAEGWLLLEWLEPAQPSADAWAALGRGLARLHDVSASEFGWDAPNYIGTLPQANDAAGSWGAFWRERRLAPQLERAYRAGYFAGPERRRFERQLVRMERLLDAGDADGPSLLHGDLWSGNVHFTESGTPAVIDPSTYHGHGEVDLAMAELFGGFAPSFFDAYREARPLRPGYAELRRPLYQLYYLLVHVNLFGRGYVAGAVGALATAEAAV